ncbi:SAM-dependent methyltransferase [Kibdelosporangium aridum]|uniref:S-adenosyl methyltransferase n=1 Tax=Kibdelosporangium aridum TaxID=2030 RepID=A0A1W2FTZ4_KIBAR|nr:SAM-dependent methyltransferase [Kibdelosporangium aridum]SMD25390.1 S-adenosyl methyltransferase [Kibdelosporangium aridum]
MTTRSEWIPPNVDETQPSGARTYDFLLGGAHNFEVDRVMAEKVKQAVPGIQEAARINRAFLGRAVRFMISQGVRQFLDVGSGIPTVGNVHEVAQHADPECRVVYVDRERVAVAHSELMLAANDRADIVHADFRDPDSILNSSQVRRLLNFDEPIGLLFLLVLHWVPDDSIGLLARYRDAAPSGSYLAITHMTADAQQDKISDVAGIVNRSRADGNVFPRAYEEIAAMFGDFELIEPGLVATGNWRPAGPGDLAKDAEMNQLSYAGIARKP